MGFICLYVFPQVVRDTGRGQGQGSEFVTVKVRGIFVTCVHLNNRGEEERIKDLKRIWEELKKKSLWKEDGAKHIFAGDFNSLTWEDYDEEGLERVAAGMKETNKKLEKAEEKRQELELAKKSKNHSHGSKEELERLLKKQLNEQLNQLGIGDWYGSLDLKDLKVLKIHLESKKLEEPKFDLTKLMKNNGFRDSWKEVEDKIVGDFGQIGTYKTCK